MCVCVGRLLVLSSSLGNRAHMLYLCAVSSVVAVTCMQRHEHQSTMCAKINRRLQDLHLRRMLGIRPVRAVGWQGGTQDGLVVFNCLLATGWKLPSNPPKGLQGCGVPLRVLFVCLFVFVFVFLGGRFNHDGVWMGSRLDGGSRGGGGIIKGGSRPPLSPPPSAPSIFRRLITTAHQAQTALQNQGEGEEGLWDCSRYRCVDMGV